MLKFKYNYQNNTLAYQTKTTETWHQLTEQFTGGFGSSGFSLADGWMTFTIRANKIRVFYKQTKTSSLTNFWKPKAATYFRKDLPKQVPVIFTFTNQDQVEKVGSVWVKKNQVLSETKGDQHE